MSDFLKLLWHLFKWAMVALGVITAGSIAWEKYVPKRHEQEWRMVMSGGESCLFAFQIPKGKWVPDTQHASNGLIRKDANQKSEPLFFSFERHWSGSEEKGSWFLPAARGCTLESKGTLQTHSGAQAKMFLATNCRKDGDYFPNFGTKHLLYGYIRMDEKDSHYMWLASDDQTLLNQNESDLKAALQSHSLTVPACAEKRKKLE